MPARHHDAIVIGGGHNALVAATLLARAGVDVVLLERREALGGAAVSAAPWPGVGVKLSRYSYLVSLFPSALLRQLGLRVELRRRRTSSYTPHGSSGILVDGNGVPHGNISSGVAASWSALQAMLAHVAARVFPTLTKPLRRREQMRRLVGDGATWRSLFEEPLSVLLERTIACDVLRGVVLTDALIGTFAAADDAELRQNRCFLYHTIGNGTGRWDVPVGGMGALSAALGGAAAAAGAQLVTGAEVVSLSPDGSAVEVTCADGTRYTADHAIAGVAPATLDRLLGRAPADPPPEGSQMKINMLVSRLPRLKDRAVSVEDAFAGTFHVNETYEQLQAAFEQAQAGQIPAQPPCELYCHSLTDPTILSDDLRAAGAQTLTLFALHMPARLFADGEAAKARAVAAILTSLNSVLAEPIEECLWRTPGGEPCLEAVTPVELEHELGMPAGHIFHRDLAWPFAESAADADRWGVETAYANVWLCGAGARRGGGVSGIPGHNAARAVLSARR